MRRIFAFFLALTLMSSFSACNTSPTQTTNAQQNETAIDFEAILRQEAFPETDEFHEILNNVVIFEDFSVNETTVHFRVRAPYIYEQLVAWYEAQEEISDDLLSDKISELLNGEKRTVEITLDYSMQNGTVMYAYTNDYLSAVGCGIREFYAYLYTKLIGGGNDG